MNKRLASLTRLAARQPALPMLVVLLVIFAVTNPYFASLVSLRQVLVRAAQDSIIAFGTTFALVGGEFDLSIGSTLAMSGLLVVGLQPLGVGPAVVAALLFGILVGLVNGLLVAKAQINAFIATLGMMIVVRGLAMIFSHGTSIANDSDAFAWLAGGSIGPVPVLLVICAAALLISELVLNWTPFGRTIFAVGSNAEASRVMGVPVNRYKIWLFVITGFAASLSGVMTASRLGGMSPLVGQDSALVAISAAVLGGTSLFGGQGGIAKTIVGVLAMSVLAVGLNLANISPYYQEIAQGGLLVVVVSLDAIVKRYSVGSNTHLVGG